VTVEIDKIRRHRRLNCRPCTEGDRFLLCPSRSTRCDWREGLDDLEIATCARVSWFNEERLHSEPGDRTSAEVEAAYRQNSQPDAA